MVAAFAGKQYKLDLSSQVNFDEYMKELGINIVTRKLGNTVSPVMTLLIDGDVYTLKATSAVKDNVIKFKLGEEFDEETADGRKVKATITVDGNKLVEVQKGADKTHTIVREFSADAIKCTMTLGSLVATRAYKAV